MVVSYGETVLEQTVGYDIYKIFEDLFLSQEKREDMILEGIQGEDLCKIRSGAGDKKPSSVDAENKLEEILGKRYRLRPNKQILTDHGILYPQALYSDFKFEIKLAPASQVVKGSDTSQLKYKLINIELEYEMILSTTLATEAEKVYTSGKVIVFDHVTCETI